MVDFIEDPQETTQKLSPIYDASTKTKEEAIEELSALLGNEISIKLYKYLPINKWVNNKYWLSMEIMQDDVIRVLKDKRFKLKKFNNDDLVTILEKKEEAKIYIGTDEERVREIFPYYSLSDENDLLMEFIFDVTIIFAQHIVAKWIENGEKYEYVYEGGIFPIPKYILPILSLFTGVNNRKFSTGEDEYSNLYFFEEGDDVYSLEITNCNAKYRLQIKKTILKEAFGNIGKNKFLTLLDTTFSYQGLFYLLAIFLSIEENGREGYIDETMVDFFNRVKGKQIKTKQINDLIKILIILGNIRISYIPSYPDERKSRYIKLFDYSGDIKKKDIRSFKIKLKSWQNLYQDYIDNKNYTIMPKCFVKESLSNNKLKFFLLTYFYFKLSETKNHIEINIKDFIEKSGLDIYGNIQGYDKKQIKHLENDLDYLRKKGYIGEWCPFQYNDENSPEFIFKKPSQFITPNMWRECNIMLSAPLWFMKLKRDLNGKTTIYLPQQIKKLQYGFDIKKYREINGLTQEKLAQALGIPRESLSNIESKNKKLNSKIANRLKKVKDSME